MNEQEQTTDRATWKVYGDGLQTFADAVLIAVLVGAAFVIAAAVFDAALLWALAPLAATVGFAVRLRSRGTQILERVERGQRP